MRKIGILWISVISLVVVSAIGAVVALALLSGDSQEDTPIPGWQRFEGGGVELWLPESWEGGDLSEDIDLIVEEVRNLGPDFEEYAQLIEENPSMFVLWVFDYEVGESGGLTNVTVCKDKVLSTMTVDKYLDSLSEQLPAPFQVIERGVVTLADQETGRLVIQFGASGEAVKELMYLIKEGTTMWFITFSTGPEEFAQRLPVFERSARTFAIQPPE
jgi:hypothetical protein